MKKLIIFISLIAVLSGLSSCNVLKDIAKQQGVNIPSSITTNNPLSNEEAINGLKNALNIGIDSAVFSLSKVNGYFGNELVKLALPPEAQTVINNISKIHVLVRKEIRNSSPKITIHVVDFENIEN